MDQNLAIQYTLVAVIILGAIIWIVIHLLRKNKKGGGKSCCGCALSESCNSKDKKQKS